MAQSFNVPKVPAQLDKGTITKFGPLGGAAVTLFGVLLVLVGLLLNWIKNGEGVSGFKVLTDNDYAVVRGGLWNGLLCTLPLFLCLTSIVAILLIVGAFWKKMPVMSKLTGPSLLGLFALLSCCPAVLFLVDLQSRDMMKGVDPDLGYYISLFGLAVALLGALVAIGVTVWSSGGLPKRKKVM
jgi:hypothetical protein